MKFKLLFVFNLMPFLLSNINNLLTFYGNLSKIFINSLCEIWYFLCKILKRNRPFSRSFVAVLESFRTNSGSLLACLVNINTNFLLFFSTDPYSATDNVLHKRLLPHWDLFEKHYTAQIGPWTQNTQKSIICIELDCLSDKVPV